MTGGLIRRVVSSQLSFITAAAIVICAAVPAGGGTGDKVIKADGQSIVMPPGTSLQQWRTLSQPGMSGARFIGKVPLTGTLYYLGASSDADDPGMVVFEPDRTTSARLPYMKADGKLPRSIGLELAGKAAAFPSPLRKAADGSKGRQAIAGPVSLAITGYLLFEDGCGANEYHFEGATVSHAGAMRLIARPRDDNKEDGDC